MIPVTNTMNTNIEVNKALHDIIEINGKFYNPPSFVRDHIPPDRLGEYCESCGDMWRVDDPDDEYEFGPDGDGTTPGFFRS